jgi:branched-chain amino acid transport system substrate-binding protein
MIFRPGILIPIAALLIVPGCFGKAEPQPIIIGHVSTLSGPGSAPGEHAVRGIRLALEELERDPGKGPGRPIVVRHTDAHDDLEAFASEAVRLVAINHAVALLGGSSPAEVERLEKGEVPLVAPVGLRTRAMGELVFLTGLTPAFQGQVLGRFAAQDLTASSAAVLVDERRDESVALGEAFVQTFAAARKAPPGASTALPPTWRFGKGSRMDEMAARVRGSKLDVVLFAGSAADLRDFLGSLKQPTLPVLWAGDDALASALPAEAKQRLYHVTAFASDADTPLVKAFVEQYRKAYHEEPDSYAALAFEDVRMLAEALRQAENRLSPAQLKEKLTGLKDVHGLTGPLSVDPDHQVRRPALVVRMEDGRWRTVKREQPSP